MESTLRLISANPVDRLARTVEALLVVASRSALDRGARARRRRTIRSESRPRSGFFGSATARVAAGSCSRPWREASRFARAARPPRRARGSSSGRSSAGSRRRHSRRSRSSRTSGRARGPDVARIRGVAADSAVASLVERGLIAEAGRESGPGGAVRYRTTPLFERVFGLESLAALPRLDDLAEDAAGAPRAAARSGRSPRVLDEPPHRLAESLSVRPARRRREARARARRRA